VYERKHVNRPKKTQDGIVVARLLELKSKAHLALRGDSNDAEHDALFELEEALVGLTPVVYRMEQALRLCLEFLQTGEIQPAGERHPYSLWAAAVKSGQLALGQRLKRGKDGKLHWKRIQKTSSITKKARRCQCRSQAEYRTQVAPEKTSSSVIS
jgi:hypothetical protein